MLTMDKNLARKLTIALVFSYLNISVVHSLPQQQSNNNNKRPLSNPSLPSAKRPTTGNTRRMTDPAFANAGQKAGLEIWRVEDFKPVPYPKNDYGKFYSGDSYVVLYTKVEKSGQKSWNIHFWLGKQTTQDEAGAAAILAVQLDDHLGGAPVQYRETEDHESQLFLSYFKNGVRYLPGGVNSGFSHVDRNAFTKHLYTVKGSRNVRVKEVDVSISSMNKGDCFILDAGQNVYVYVGQKSKRIERIKAIAAANQIRDQDHAGRAKVTIIDEFSPQSDYDEFFAALGGGDRNSVPDETTGGDDQKFEKDQEKIVSLYQISDESGSVKMNLIGQKPLQQSQLNSKDCFILDTDSNIFVWVGKQCTAREKSEAMNKAQQFLTSKNYPSWTQVQRIVEGAEPAAFTQYFQSWKGYGELRPRLHRSIASDEHDGFEPRLFHAQIKYKNGRFIIEEVFDFEQRDLNEDDIMLLDIGKELFVWVGSAASDEEKAKAETAAKLYLKKYQREGDDVKVTIINQGDEPEEFTSLFSSWNPDLWETLTSYSDVKERVKQANENVQL